MLIFYTKFFYTGFFINIFTDYITYIKLYIINIFKWLPSSMRNAYSIYKHSD